MDKLPPNPILEFNPNQLIEVRKTFNYGDVNRLHQDLNIFQDWIKMQHHFLVKQYGYFMITPKEYLERYLINSKGSIERAKKLLDKICTMRSLLPEYLQGFDMTAKNEFENALKVIYGCVLPKPTRENYRIVFYTAHNSDGKLFNQLEITKFLLMSLQYLMCHDYNAGIEIICDTTNYSLGIITRLNPIMMTNTANIIVDALGLRMKGIHLISGSKFLDTMIAIVKQALPKKLVSRLHVYENFEALFKVFPKDLLPKDIGGGLDFSIDGITKNNVNEFSSPAFIKQIKCMDKAATDESKRLCAIFNEEYSGTPGSFKVMTVD